MHDANLRRSQETGSSTAVTGRSCNAMMPGAVEMRFPAAGQNQMNAHDLRDLRWTLRSVVGEVVATGESAFVTDGGEEVVVIMSTAEYARLRATG